MEEKTILEIIQRATDEIADALRKNDCSERVAIHVSKNTGLVNLSINEETYVRHYNLNMGWQKL